MSLTMKLINSARNDGGIDIFHYKGGGSDQTSSTKSSSSTKLNAAFKPVVDTGLADLKSAYDSGALGRVAGESDLQREAFDAASGTADLGLDAIRESRDTFRDAMSGEGLFDPASIAEMERAAIDQANKEEESPTTIWPRVA